MLRVGMGPWICPAELAGLLDAGRLQVSPAHSFETSNQDLLCIHNLAIDSGDLL